jgi:hypothetical protein
MRLTVNLEPELYSIAKSLAKAEDCSISAAVNQLLKRSLMDAGKSQRSRRVLKRNGLIVSRGKRAITADVVHKIDEES